MWIALPLLVIAIGTEVGATAVLPRAQGFTDPVWTAVVLGGYGLSIYLLTVIVRYLPVSVTYAVWAGLGTAAIAVVGVVALGESMDPLKFAALTLIVAGVVMLNLHGAH